MSKLSNPLPLPQANHIIKERADLLTAWEAVNDWYGEAVSPTGLYHGDGFRHFAGSIIFITTYTLDNPHKQGLQKESEFIIAIPVDVKSEKKSIRDLASLLFE